MKKILCLMFFLSGCGPEISGEQLTGTYSFSGEYAPQPFACDPMGTRKGRFNFIFFGDTVMIRGFPDHFLTGYVGINDFEVEGINPIDSNSNIRFQSEDFVEGSATLTVFTHNSICFAPFPGTIEAFNE